MIEKLKLIIKEIFFLKNDYFILEYLFFYLMAYL